MTEPLAPTTIGERQAIAEGGERRCLLDERIRIVRQVTASYDGLDWPADVREAWKRIEAALATPTTNAPVAAQPIDMLLFCPKCGKQHIDEPESVIGTGGFLPDEPGDTWDNPPHRSHLCHECGCIWRPADVPTNGVARIETTGKADTWDAAAIRARQTLPIHEALEGDPDLGKIGPGHVCKHGIRWPHSCGPCDNAAWENRHEN